MQLKFILRVTSIYLSALIGLSTDDTSDINFLITDDVSNVFFACIPYCKTWYVFLLLCGHLLKGRQFFSEIKPFRNVEPSATTSLSGTLADMRCDKAYFMRSEQFLHRDLRWDFLLIQANKLPGMHLYALSSSSTVQRGGMLM